MKKLDAMVEPKVGIMRGSYFPPLSKTSSGWYTVETLDGTLNYYGTSEHVARLIVACMTPRSC